MHEHQGVWRSIRSGVVGVLAGIGPCVSTMSAQPVTQTPIPAPVQTQGYEPLVLRIDAEKQNWTLKGEIRIYGANPERESDLRATRYRVDKAVLLYPIATDTSSTRFYDVEIRAVAGSDDLGDFGASRRLDGYQAGQSYLAFDVEDYRGTTLGIDVTTTMTSYQTTIDEERAFGVDWPTGDYPEAIAASLKPQTFVESDSDEIKRLVDAWTNAAPMRAKPYFLAKHLAWHVVEWYTPNERPFVQGQVAPPPPEHPDVVPLFDERPAPTGYYQGLDVKGAAHAARERQGSPLDMANLLCAVYRAAGLPARVVIGHDNRAYLEEERPTVTAWVEFYMMVDPEQNRGEWIPVDIVRQHAFATRAPEVTRPWKYFGNSDHSQNYSVIGFHWLPPTFVLSPAPPALWGWLPHPQTPAIRSGMRFTAHRTLMTLERQRRRTDSP